MAVEITLMRHGRSRADDEGVHEGRYDSPLTDVGRSQVRRRAASWAEAGISFARIVCSPLVRARECARIVAEVLGGTADPDPSWLETDNGRLAGLPFTEANVRFPAPYAPTPYSRIGFDGESPVDLHARASLAMQALAVAGVSPVLVVAHGGVINAAIRSALGMSIPIAGNGASFAFGDAGFIRLRYESVWHGWTVLEFEPGEITS